jgi:hypothetical protein
LGDVIVRPLLMVENLRMKNSGKYLSTDYAVS